MAIEFHCEHCNHLIKAPDDAGGKQGKCPRCGGINYIRRPPAETGELDLAPIDEAEESRRARQAREDANIQWKLLHERSVPGEPGGKGAGRGVPSEAAQVTSKQLTGLIVKYVDAMSQGKLAEAGAFADQLTRHRVQVTSILDEMAGEDLSGYGMPALPKPVLVGFLKQLRGKL